MRGDPTSPLQLRYTHKNTLVFAIREGLSLPRTVLRGRKLDRTGWQVTASHGRARAQFAVDADPETSWTSYGDLEDVLETRWFDPIPLVERWRHFLDDQPTLFEVDLGSDQTISAVVVRLGGSDPAVAPKIVIEGSADGVAWTRLAGELDPVPDAHAIVSRPYEARFALTPETAARARFLRLSCKGLEWRIGDLDVYAE
jgi:hypothetical protein